MTGKSVVPRAQTRRDIEDAVDHYVREAGESVVLGLIAELESANRAISRQPSSGSPRYDHELNLPGLRSHQLRRYPFMIFYVERADHLDVWRVLHAQKDIPASISRESG